MSSTSLVAKLPRWLTGCVPSKPEGYGRFLICLLINHPSSCFSNARFRVDSPQGRSLVNDSWSVRVRTFGPELLKWTHCGRRGYAVVPESTGNTSS